ncbi:MAG: TA0938 family protein [Thermoplasmata archaeon]|nr:TA0938 family protein [Thermoplasmata archaeon]
MKLRDDGCVLCGSTWGDHWADVEGTRRFFCCEVCALQFRNLLAALRRELGGTEIRRLEIAGDRHGRKVTVEHDERVIRFGFVFGPDGEVRRLHLDPAPRPTP